MKFNQNTNKIENTFRNISNYNSNNNELHNKILLKESNKTINYRNEFSSENYDLNLFEIISPNKKTALSINSTITYNNEEIDNIKIEIGDIRLNICEQYIKDIINSFFEYKIALKTYHLKKGINMLSNNTKQNIKEKIYNYLIKLPEQEKNEEIKCYIEYLKQNITGEQFIKELKIIYNYFINGIEVFINYGKIEYVCYKEKNINSILLKCSTLPGQSYLKIDENKIIFLIAQSYFEINNLQEFNLSKNIIKNMIIEKFSIFKIIFQSLFIKY